MLSGDVSVWNSIHLSFVEFSLYKQRVRQANLSYVYSNVVSIRLFLQKLLLKTSTLVCLSACVIEIFKTQLFQQENFQASLLLLITIVKCFQMLSVFISQITERETMEKITQTSRSSVITILLLLFHVRCHYSFPIPCINRLLFLIKKFNLLLSQNLLDSHMKHNMSQSISYFEI